MDCSRRRLVAPGDVRVDLRDPALAVDSLCEALAALTHLRPGEPNVVLEITEIPG